MKLVSYISSGEREHYKALRTEDSKLGDDKVKLARRQVKKAVSGDETVSKSV